MKKVLSILSAPHSHWVGDGFPAKTLFSYQTHGKSISPFLLLDYAGPMKFSPTKRLRGVGAHPHRGFETVTLTYQGELAHKDSTGERGLIGPGDVQWMTAANGIVHEEFHSPAFSKNGGILEMMQLWVNLPSNHKLDKPRYQTIKASQFPHIDLPDKRGYMRLIAGEINGNKGPAMTYTPMLVMDGLIKASGQFSVPTIECWTAIVVIRNGQLRANGRLLTTGQTVIFSQAGADLDLEALQDTELLVLSAEPINEPIVGYGPFVMNSEVEVKQAMADFQAGKFGNLEHT
ncbi:pirin family protein [Pseudoalteromonas mariniglutinosa]|uniref:pirin family protein n=1 Tax=Pseudoalteromonas mariniglutinosa TaxID=206042 RepID=UPI00384E0972